jgi:hypothetical protein
MKKKKKKEKRGLLPIIIICDRWRGIIGQITGLWLQLLAAVQSHDSCPMGFSDASES